MSIIDPQQAMNMIQECFFDFYLCPECQTGPKTKKQQENRIDTEIKIDFHGCQCLKLRLYKHHYNKDAMVFHVKDEIQWVAWTESFPNKIRFKVVEGATRFAVEQIILHNSTLEYDHIPSFVFKPLNQMIQNIQTLVTFQ